MTDEVEYAFDVKEIDPVILKIENDAMRQENRKLRRRMWRLKRFWRAHFQIYGFEDDPPLVPPTYDELLSWWNKQREFLAYNAKEIGW